MVREVFNRLLGVHGESCITPTELLVALHLLDQTKVDLKAIMKSTSMCISEKQVSANFNEIFIDYSTFKNSEMSENFTQTYILIKASK